MLLRSACSLESFLQPQKALWLAVIPFQHRKSVLSALAPRPACGCESNDSLRSVHHVSQTYTAVTLQLRRGIHRRVAPCVCACRAAHWPSLDWACLRYCSVVTAASTECCNAEHKQHRQHHRAFVSVPHALVTMQSMHLLMSGTATLVMSSHKCCKNKGCLLCRSGVGGGGVL